MLIYEGDLTARASKTVWFTQSYQAFYFEAAGLATVQASTHSTCKIGDEPLPPIDEYLYKQVHNLADAVRWAVKEEGVLLEAAKQRYNEQFNLTF